jgi:hypothetical protein
MTNDDQFHRYRYFKDAAEFRALEGYVDSANATPADFEDAIGWYSFKKRDWIKCSLTCCRTTHGDGVVVRLRDRRITNVGNVCGKAYGDAFHAALRAIERQKEMDAIRAGLERYRRDAPQQAMQLEGLRTGQHGTRSLSRAKQTLCEMLPNELTRKLTFKAHKNQRTVSRVVPRTDAEIEIAKAQQPSLHGDALRYKEEEVGYLVGLSLFSRDPDDILEKKVDDPLRHLASCHAAASPVRLRRLHKELENVGPGLLEAERALDEGWSFFQDSNIALLEMMVDSESDRAKIRGAWQRLLATSVRSAA